jgi:hypothetical protein
VLYVCIMEEEGTLTKTQLLEDARQREAITSMFSTSDGVSITISP